jgi:membrane-associated phospholipid phosphatase
LQACQKTFRMRATAILVMIFLFPAVSFSQKDTLIKKLDSLEIKADTGKQVNNINHRAYNESSKITFPVYWKLLWSDSKQQLTAPFRGTRQDYYRLAGLVGVTAALSFADKPIEKAALKARDSSKTLRDISSYVTNFGANYEVYVLAAFGTYGFIFNSQKVKTTTLLATQSYITAVVIESVLKVIAGRERPSYINPESNQLSSRFYGPFHSSSNDFKSFPSGHTTAAFAAATVYAMEYKKSIAVPIISYGAATLVGMSRITENKHWTTDVLMGATLGYLCGRQVVNNYHRYAKLKAPGQKKNSVSFNLNYNSGHIEPGIAYKF